MSVMLLSKSRKSWNLPSLTAGHAFVLTGLEWGAEPSRVDAIDASVFYALNGSLSDSRAWQLLWPWPTPSASTSFPLCWSWSCMPAMRLTARQITDRISAVAWC